MFEIQCSTAVGAVHLGSGIEQVDVGAVGIGIGGGEGHFTLLVFIDVPGTDFHVGEVRGLVGRIGINPEIVVG